MYRSARNFVPPLVMAGVGIPFFVILLASIAEDQPSDAGVSTLIIVPMILILAAWAIRGFPGRASLTIDENELVYRTTMTAKRIPRSRIVDLGIEKTTIGASLRKVWVPYLTLHDGSKLQLTYLSTGIVGGTDVPDRYSINTQRMLKAVHAWLDRPGSHPRPVISPQAEANQAAIRVLQAKAGKGIRAAAVVQLVGFVLVLAGHAFGSALYVVWGSVLVVGLLFGYVFVLRYRRLGRQDQVAIK